MGRARLQRIGAIAGLALLAATATFAVRTPDKTGIASAEYRHPALSIRTDVISATDQLAADPALVADLATLGLAPARAFVDGRTNRWATLLPSRAMIPGAGNDLTWDALGLAAAPASRTEIEALAWDAFSSWVASNQGALRIDPSEFGATKVTVHDDGRLVQIWISRQVGGIPVRGAAITAVINNGNLNLFGAEKWGDVDAFAVPSLPADEAAAIFTRYVAPFVVLESSRKGRLEYVPMARGEDPRAVVSGRGLEHRLAWVFQPRFAGSDAEWEAVVDAHDGELISFEDKTNYASTRTVIGGVYPVSNDGVGPDGTMQSYPMPYANLTVGAETYVTDAGGNLQACVDGSISTDLTGPYLAITDNCGAVNETTATDVLDLAGTGFADNDCDVPAGGHSAGDTSSSRTAFYEVNKIAEIGRAHLPGNAWLQQPLPVEVNIDLECNATGGPGGLRFYRSGGGCNNSGEIAGVFDHEWGHGMDGADAAPGISNPGEGIADIYASLRLNSSCIGRNFFQSGNCGGYGNACLTCDGIRDIDFAQHATGAPITVTIIDNAAVCGTGPAPCGGGVHCEGQVYSQSVWDLWNRDLTAAPFNMSLDTAREVATRLIFTGGQLVSTWFQCVQGSGGCPATSGYMNLLAADDTDGNLSNGTPHMQAIHAAFNRHGIACATPAVANSGCAGAPSTAPVVVGQALDRGASLTWGAVSGATRYRVYRAEGVNGCAFGKTLIGETTGTSWVDTDGLKNGLTYNYIVIPMSAGLTCFGPASSCTPVVPAPGPNFAQLPGVTLNVTTGDADAFLDNCEEATVSFDITNVGNATLTNPRITAVSSPSHPLMNPTIDFPATIAPTLAVCASAEASFDLIGAGLSYGDVAEFDVVLTSDELSPLTKTFRVEVEFAETDLQFNASKTFSFEGGNEGWVTTSGTFNRSGAGGGNGTIFSKRSSALIDNACDRVRSPLLQLAATSTLSLYNNYDIEPFSGGTWYDRANVAIEVQNGSRIVVSPTSGRTYNAVSGGPGSYSGCNEPEPGWAATQNTWNTSSWNAAAFGALATGVPAQLEVTYATDGALAQNGFWFDQVTITDVTLATGDASSNVCAANPLIFANGFESGDTSAWSSTVP